MNIVVPAVRILKDFKSTVIHGSDTDHMDSDEWRHEMKYVLPGHMESGARLRLLGNGAGFKTAYPPRVVNNIYFDTVDQQAALSNFSGIGERSKVRLRWYGDTSVAESAVVEVKIKSKGAGKKLHHPVASSIDLSNINWRDLRKAMIEGSDPTVRIHIDRMPVPMLFNSYRREYYESFDGAVRATIDSNITSIVQRGESRPRLSHMIPPAELLVVELKAAVGNEKKLRSVAGSLGWRVGRNSKYIRGMSGGV